MAKKPSLAAALAAASGKPSTTPAAPATAPAQEAQPSTQAKRPPSRVGKKMIGSHIDPAAHKELAIAALMEDKKIDHVIREALNMWLESRGRPPVC